MTTREATKAYRLNQWTQVIREYRNSGQTVSAWCKEHDIDPKKYYYWLKCVRKAASEALPATIADSPIVPLNLSKANSSAGVTTSNEVVATISLGEVVVRLSNYASSEFITNVLNAIQHAR